MLPTENDLTVLVKMSWIERSMCISSDHGWRSEERTAQCTHHPLSQPHNPHERSRNRVTDTDKETITVTPHLLISKFQIPLLLLMFWYIPTNRYFFHISHLNITPNIKLLPPSYLFCFFFLLRPHCRLFLASPIHFLCFVIFRAAKGSSVRDIK